jgi:hypothetical protein
MFALNVLNLHSFVHRLQGEYNKNRKIREEGIFIKRLMTFHNLGLVQG